MKCVGIRQHRQDVPDYGDPGVGGTGGSQSALDEAGQMAGDREWLLGLVHVLKIRDKLRVCSQHLVQPRSQQRFVYPRFHNPESSR